MNEFFNTLTEEAIRKKPRDAIGKYLSASPGCVLTVGIYNGGGLYVYSNSDEPLGLLYDVGSLTKTLTAHLITTIESRNFPNFDRKCKICEQIS